MLGGLLLSKTISSATVMSFDHACVLPFWHSRRGLMEHANVEKESALLLDDMGKNL